MWKSRHNPGRTACQRKNEVTFIDTAPELLKKVMGMIDVQVIEGNCTVYSTLKEAGIEHAVYLLL